MRTSPVRFNDSFFRPLTVNNTPQSSQPTVQKQEPLIYSSRKYGKLNKFIGSADFKQFQEEYRAVLKSIKDFVHRHVNDIHPQLSDADRKKVDANFGALEERLFGGRAGRFDSIAGAKEGMYQEGKKIFHEFAELLQDKDIPLQNRMDAVLTLNERLEACFGGVESDLSHVTAILMAYKYGLKGRAHQWKMEMLDQLIVQHVGDNHDYEPLEEIHFVNAYYNQLAEEMGVEQRSDNSVGMYRKNILPLQLDACRKHVHENLKPMQLIANAIEHYRSRIEEFFHKENIDAGNIDEIGFEKLKAAMQALKPEYGDVALPVVVESDPDTYQLAYSGQQQPIRGTRHFLKTFRKLGVIDYDKQSKVELGKTDEGTIVMVNDLFWVKEMKHAPVYELTASFLLKLAPEELLANIEEAEPEDMQARSFLLRKVVDRAHEMLTAEGNTGEQLDGWLRDFAVAMKERPSWPQGWTDPVMLLAISFGQASALRDLLKAGGNKEVKDRSGNTALIIATERGDAGMVQALLKAEANIEAKNWYEKTPLILAVERGDTEVVQALLKARANIEAKDEYGNTPLIWAVERGDVGMVAALLKEGADIEAQDGERMTPLIRAAEKGDAGLVAALLEKKADIEAKDEYGNTALIWAIKQGHAGVVIALLEKKAVIEAQDQYGNTALILAIRLGHVAVVDALLQTEVNIEAKGLNGKTALIWAAESGHAGLVAALLEKKAVIEAQDQYGNTALIRAAESGHAEVVAVLLKEGADIEAKGMDDWTALIAAAKKGHAEVVAALLKKGADTEVKDEDGNTALVLADLQGHTEVRALLETETDKRAIDRSRARRQEP